jgi:hypothetical protein
MKRIFLIGLAIICIRSFVFGQDVLLYDEFGRIQCGDFMARMDAIWYGLEKAPSSSNVYVIYFGARYRKSTEGEGQKSVLRLEHPHRDDGLSWAKTIPLYLSTYRSYSEDFRTSIKDRIFLIDGGYKEDISVQIWIGTVPPPKPVSQIDPTLIRFQDRKPRGTLDYTKCYDDY